MKNLEKINENYLSQLEKKLEDAGIDTSVWGKGSAKTIEHLQNEIDKGEATLIEVDNELLRKVIVGNADIFYDAPDNKKYKLKEEKQIFKDGRVRERDSGGAVSEKMKINEDPTDAMKRGIEEELQIKGDINIKKLGNNEKIITSPSYPGLKTQYTTHSFEVFLKEEQFNPDGYVENQEDKNTYFIWECIL